MAKGASREEALFLFIVDAAFLLLVVMIGSRPSMAGRDTGFVAAQQCDRGDDMFMRLVNEVLSLFDGDGLAR